LILSHKIKLKPNKYQTQEFVKACGCARFSYNWALKEYQKQYINNQKPNINDLRKQFNQIKQKEFPWIYDSPKDANQRPFINLKNAFSRFFKKISKYPTLKKKGIRDSFYVSNDKFKLLENKKIKLPRIGIVKLTENLRFKGKIQSAVISRTANDWFVSITVDASLEKQRISNEIVGIDLGLNNFTVDSNNAKTNAPKPLKFYTKKLARLHRRLSKKKLGSKNKIKARQKLAKLYQKINNIRQDFIHKLSYKYCNENQIIILEDLSVKNMLKNHKLAKAISDVSWGEFRRQLDYKKNIFDNTVVKIDRFYPSSKTCSCCGNIKKELKLEDRVYICDECGLEIDRDFNAATNIKNEGLRILQNTEGYSEINACGQTYLFNDNCFVVESKLDETRILHNHF